jgi:Fe-S-cluster-containing dehydrogenase component/formate-dependent nitrite reductase membrane component NrfD
LTAAAGETSAVRFGFVIDNRRCIGCHACTVACKSEHDVPLGVNRTWVKQVETGTFPDVHRSFHVMRCNHCADAPCVEICPVSALYVRPNGIVDFDNGRCIGCKGCLQACPYDALYIDPRNDTAAKCNFCSHRVERGLQPACVVACPEQAIVAGDLQDPASYIAQLVANEAVQVRKPEKGTRPSLYYIEGEREALDPLVADNRRCTTTDRPADDRRPLEALGVIAETRSRVSYDAPKNAPPWGWHVSGYLLTKALAAGLLLLPLGARLLLGTDVPRSLALACGVASLLFQAATAALLVADLQRPDRFLNVLLRGNPTSWLVRGAWILTALGGASTLWLAAEWLGWSLATPAAWACVLLSPAAAIYTAFLFAQAKGRDLWQSKLQPLHMGLHGVIAGAAGVLLLQAAFGSGEGLAQLARWVLLVGLPLDALLALSEIVLPHATPAAAAAARHLHAGEAAARFWGVIVAGSVLGAALATLPQAAPLAALLALLVVYVRNDLWVRAGQKVPLS